PWRSRRDSVLRINMSSEPGNESFFCALRPIPRILSLRRRDYASQVQIGESKRRKTISGCSRAPDANGARCCRPQAASDLNCRKTVRALRRKYLINTIMRTQGRERTRSHSPRPNSFDDLEAVAGQTAHPVTVLPATTGANLEPNFAGGEVRENRLVIVE